MSIDPHKASSLLVSLTSEIPPQEVVAQIGVPTVPTTGHIPAPSSTGQASKGHANGEPAYPAGATGTPEALAPGSGKGSARRRVFLHRYLHALFETRPELSAPYQNLQVSPGPLGFRRSPACAPLVHRNLDALFETHPELSAPYQNLQVIQGPPWLPFLVCRWCVSTCTRTARRTQEAWCRGRMSQTSGASLVSCAGAVVRGVGPPVAHALPQESGTLPAPGGEGPAYATPHKSRWYGVCTEGCTELHMLVCSFVLCCMIEY